MTCLLCLTDAAPTRRRSVCVLLLTTSTVRTSNLEIRRSTVVCGGKCLTFSSISRLHISIFPYLATSSKLPSPQKHNKKLLDVLNFSSRWMAPKQKRPSYFFGWTSSWCGGARRFRRRRGCVCGLCMGAHGILTVSSARWCSVRCMASTWLATMRRANRFLFFCHVINEKSAVVGSLFAMTATNSLHILTVHIQSIACRKTLTHRHCQIQQLPRRTMDWRTTPHLHL